MLATWIKTLCYKNPLNIVYSSFVFVSCFNRLNMLQLTVQFIHLFVANLMFKGMTPVPVILRMIYVNTRIKNFFRATFLDQSKIKQKPIANCSPTFSRVKSRLHSLRNLIGSCDYQLVFWLSVWLRVLWFWFRRATRIVLYFIVQQSFVN